MAHMQAFDQLGIRNFLAKEQKWSPEDISLAETHIISRTVYPASELKTVSFIKENSAICELTGYDRDKVTKDKLYRISHRLYAGIAVEKNLEMLKTNGYDYLCVSRSNVKNYYADTDSKHLLI